MEQLDLSAERPALIHVDMRARHRTSRNGESSLLGHPSVVSIVANSSGSALAQRHITK